MKIETMRSTACAGVRGTDGLRSIMGQGLP